jgi:hypothetical protein
MPKGLPAPAALHSGVDLLHRVERVADVVGEAARVDDVVGAVERECDLLKLGAHSCDTAQCSRAVIEPRCVVGVHGVSLSAERKRRFCGIAADSRRAKGVVVEHAAAMEPMRVRVMKISVEGDVVRARVTAVSLRYACEEAGGARRGEPEMRLCMDVVVPRVDGEGTAALRERVRCTALAYLDVE